MSIAKRGIFRSKQLAKMIIINSIIFQEKKILTKMLYNQEIILV